MSRSFNQQLDQHGAWRSNFAHRLQWLTRWLTENELLDQAVAERLRGLELQIRNSKVMVAFVAALGFRYAVRRSSSGYVLTRSLEDAVFFQHVTTAGILKAEG